MSEHTPGPWRWEFNPSSKRLELCGGKIRYDLTVMGFVRYGMNGAAPCLNDGTPGVNIMHRFDRWAKAVPGREHHSDWFQAINHPDMRLIEAAPDLLEALAELVMLKDDVKTRDPVEYERRKDAAWAAARVAVIKARGAKP